MAEAGKNKGSKLEMVVKVLMMFVISLLSFSIGAYVGKKFSDSQHKLAKLEHGDGGSHSSNRGVASTHDKASSNHDLSEDEVAKMAEEFLKDEGSKGGSHHKEGELEKPIDHQAGASETNHHTPNGNDGHSAYPPAGEESSHSNNHAGHAADKAQSSHSREVNIGSPNQAQTGHAAVPSHDPLKDAAQGLVKGKALPMPEVAKEPRVPTSLPKLVAQSPDNKFTVQVGSYASEQEAQKRAVDLKTKGFAAFYSPAIVNGQNWYRVNVGLFTTQNEAMALKSELAQKAQVNESFVQKISQ